MCVCHFRWSQFRDLVDQKKENLNSALGVQNYHLECNETKSWIKEKTKVQNSTGPTLQHFVSSQQKTKIVFMKCLRKMTEF